jgi:hypothetical protein
VRLNIRVSILNFLMIFFSLCIYLFSDLLYIKYVAYIYFFAIYFRIFKRAYLEKMDIVDLLIAYLLLYPLFGVIVFSEEELIQKLSSFINGTIIFDKESVFKYIFLIMIGLIPFSYITSTKLSVNLRKKNVRNIRYDLVGIFAEVGLVFFTLFLIYLYYITGGQYIWFTDVANKSELFNLVSIFSIFLSPLISLAYVDHDYKSKKRFTLLVIFVIVLIFLLKIRMYAALYIFSLLLNLNIRNMKFTRKRMSFLLVTLVILLFGNILRFQHFDFTNIWVVLFSTFGEFIMPNISSYYMITNPLGFNEILKIKDLFLQLLPSIIRPYPVLYEFRDFYLSRGIDPWPIGGLYFQGQLYFYFNVFYIIPMFFVSLYLIKIKEYMYNKIYSISIVSLPIFSMVLPRMEIWVLRSALFAVIIFIIVRGLYKSVR